MKLIGRKQYHAWSENLTIGFGLITNQWSRFVANPKQDAVIKLFDLQDVMGEIIARPIGAPVKNFYGRDVNFLISEAEEAWTPCEPWEPGIGFCGRRLLTTWTDKTMLCIDKIVGPTERFDVRPRQWQSAMLYDIFEVAGELVEVKKGRPARGVYGWAANDLVTGGAGCWEVGKDTSEPEASAIAAP
jgi:hypothetical protein